MCAYNRAALNQGLTFLEMVIALSLFAVALVGFLQIFNTALDASYRATQESIATNLARALLAEIMTKNFADPEEPGNPLGPDTDPNGITETRHGGVGYSFDDVDDYDGYSDSPPAAIDGTLLDGTAGTANYSDFSRSVTVVYCDIVGSDIVEVAGPTDYKMVTVTASGPYVRDISIVEVKTNLP